MPAILTDVRGYFIVILIYIFLMISNGECFLMCKLAIVYCLWKNNVTYNYIIHIELYKLFMYCEY